ncbi:hypothetical protein G9A89_001870 [Geosiphon pyriformis]|nr:hypothetical protein G9A89_001870 [Geosiphon pyriformis]
MNMSVLKAFYHDIAIKNWTCDNMIEHYRTKSEHKDRVRILDRIRKDLQEVANSDSECDIVRKGKAQDILDDWKNWTTQKNMKRSSDMKIGRLQIKKMKNFATATGRATQIVDGNIVFENCRQDVNDEEEMMNTEGASILSKKNNDENQAQTKQKINEFFPLCDNASHPFQHEEAHENVNNGYDNEELVITSELQCYKDNFSKEDSLLQENPYAIVDCKLIINSICIRSTIEKWRESSKYIEEIHKQDLMRYNILDTTSLSATEARKLFKEHWNDVIKTIEEFLSSSSNVTSLASNSAPISSLADQDTEQDGRAEDVKQYLKNVLKNVNSAKKLGDAIKTERERLRTNGNTKWKKRVLELMKIFRKQFQNDRNCLKEHQSEGNYIIKFISHIFTMLFEDKLSLNCRWGESTLQCSAILLNQSLRDDYRRRSGNKIDSIISMVDLDLEVSIVEVSGSPSYLDHTHYVEDKNKTAKMLKIILNYIKINYSGDFEEFRRIKIYGVQIYDHNFHIYSMCMPFAGIYYFKLEKKFSYPKIPFLLFKKLPKFASNLWIMRDMIISSTESILIYVTNTISESSDDDSKLDEIIHKFAEAESILPTPLVEDHINGVQMLGFMETE